MHLIKNLYIHFAVEHIQGHHKKVATEEDPASAPKGISLYRFIPKSIMGGYISAFKFNPIFVCMSTLASFLFVCGVYRFYGLAATIYFLVLASGGIFIL